MKQRISNQPSPTSLDHLRVLEVLLRTCSPSVASKELGISASAVSHTLSKLRAEFGDRLLVRRGDKMLLTPLGERLRRPLAIALDSLQRTLEVVRSPDHPAVMAVAMRDQFAMTLGPSLIAHLARGGENCQLLVAAYDREQVADQLARGDFHFAIAVDPPEASNLRMRTLYRDRFVLLSPTKAPPTVDDYFAARHVVTAAHSEYRAIDSACAKIGRARNVASRVPYFASAAHLAEKCGLFTMLPSRVAEVLRADRLHVHPVPFHVPDFVVSLVWDVRFDRDEESIRMRQLVVDAARSPIPGRERRSR